MTVLSMDPRVQARRVEVMRLRGRRRLKVLLVLCVGTLIALGAWWTVLHSPWFDVDAVTVQGVERTDPAEVIAAADIEVGQPLLNIETSAAEQAVAALPWVATVDADAGLGGEVSLVVTERVPVAAVPGADGWLVVDADGRVLEHRVGVPTDVTVVEGRAWNAEPGGWIGEGALPALDVAALLPANLRTIVASVRSDARGLQLVLFGGGVVELGDALELDQKFLSTLTLLMRVDLGCLDRIDVRAPRVPVLTRLDGCPYSG